MTHASPCSLNIGVDNLGQDQNIGGINTRPSQKKGTRVGRHGQRLHTNTWILSAPLEFDTVRAGL